MSDRRLRGALALLLALAPACIGGRSYVPLASTPATARPGTLTLASLETHGLNVALPGASTAATSGLTVRLRWNALEPGSAVARAFLVPPSPDAAACTVGIAAELFEIDGQIRWDRPADLGARHEVALGFPADPRLDGGPLDLDVEIVNAAGTSCITVPLTGEPQRYSDSSSLTGTSAISAMSTVRSRRRSAVGFDYAVGRWAGPVRFTLRFGADFGQSFRAIYPGTFETSFIDYHLAPELAFLPVVRGRLALAVSAAYVVGTGTSGSGTVADPRHETDYSGPRLALMFAAIKPAPLGATWHRPEHLVGLELSLLRATAWPGDPFRGATYIVGVGMVSW